MQFVRNCWYVASWSNDVEAGKLFPRILLNEGIVLFRDDDGRIQAIEDRCPHRHAPLHMGTLIDGGRIRCGYHGLEFDGSGHCVRNPHASGRISPAAKVRAYPVLEKHSLIWIWMGDKPADPDAIPDFSLLDGSHEISRRDYILMRANYALVVDNLMDLSHAAFLHDGILGSKETIQAEYEVTQEGNQITVARQCSNVPVPGLFDLMFKRDGGHVDLWADIRWDVPGCLMNDTGVTSPGAPRDQGTGIYGMHFLTPETETSCHYHFVAARQNPINWGEPVDSEIRTKISDLRRFAFEFQDKAMIEAQQQLLSRSAAVPPFVLLETDAGTARYRRVLESLIAAEREAAFAQGRS
ncbi:MAG: aromatic ring-hydroxylating dioxygenase subunit alpha [Burkholderiales bacterium]|nr:aromatic ring-hydroxylating dioxygenase subunit alpha [Burkholderiales bacterium]